MLPFTHPSPLLNSCLPQIRSHLHGHDLQCPSLWDHDHTDLLVLYNLQTVSLPSKLYDDKIIEFDPSDKRWMKIFVGAPFRLNHHLLKTTDYTDWCFIRLRYSQYGIRHCPGLEPPGERVWYVPTQNIERDSR